MLAPAVSGPPRGGLGIGEKVLVDEQVLVRERGERFAHLQDRPQQQPFGFLAVVVKGGFRLGEAGEPRAQRVEIGVGGDLHASAGAVRAATAIEVGRQVKRIERARGGQGGGHGREGGVRAAGRT